MRRHDSIFKIRPRPSNSNASRFSRKKKNKDNSRNKMLFFHLPISPKPKKVQLSTSKFRITDQESLLMAKLSFINSSQRGLKVNLEHQSNSQTKKI